MSTLGIRPIAANPELTIEQQRALEAPDLTPKVSGVALYALQNPGAVVRAFRPSARGCKEVVLFIGCATGMAVAINYGVGPLTGQRSAPLSPLLDAIKAGAGSGTIVFCLKKLCEGLSHINSEHQAHIMMLTHQVFIRIISDDPVLGEHLIRFQFRQNPVLAPEHFADADTRAMLIQRFGKFQEHAFFPLDVQRVLELCVKNGFIDMHALRTPAEQATHSSLGCVPKEILGTWIAENLEGLQKAEAKAAQRPGMAIQISDEEKGDVVVAHEAPERSAPRQQNGVVHWVKWLFGCARTPA